MKNDYHGIRTNKIVNHYIDCLNFDKYVQFNWICNLIDIVYADQHDFDIVMKMIVLLIALKMFAYDDNYLRSRVTWPLPNRPIS